MIISIDGIIGAGKSTILETLKMFGKSVYLEPYARNPILPRFYKDIPRFAAMCQAVFFPLRADMQLSIPSQGVHFIERSCYSDKHTFGEMLKSSMEPEEWEGYTIFFDLLTSKFNLLPDLTIIIDEKPETCLQRIKERGREMEKGITLDYLIQLKNMYWTNRYKLGKEIDWWVPSDIPENIKKRTLYILEILSEKGCKK